MEDGGAIAGEDIALNQEADVMLVQHRVAYWSRRAGMSTFQTTRLVTAASDLARNAIVHGGGGAMRVDLFEAGMVRMVFADHGPGIASIENAMRDGFTTGGGLGLGLPGARRLVDQFSIESAPGKGTRVTIAMRRR